LALKLLRIKTPPLASWRLGWRCSCRRPLQSLLHSTPERLLAVLPFHYEALSLHLAKAQRGFSPPAVLPAPSFHFRTSNRRSCVPLRSDWVAFPSLIPFLQVQTLRFEFLLQLTLHLYLTPFSAIFDPTR
jgi:hypothetical protein